MLTRLLIICCVSLTAFTETKISFSEQIRPILNRKCTGCHGGVKQAGGLSLLYKEMAYGKTNHGYGIVPGKPEESMVYKVITSPPEVHDVKKGKYRHLEKMPLEKEPLTKDEIALIKKWIEQGATWEEHWAYENAKKYESPSVKTKGWSKNYIDAFTLAKMEEKGFIPSSPATKGELIRRLALDLTGVPPTLEDYRAFIADNSPNAYEKLVDKYLNDPNYGERWAGMWLDLARYSDTQGYEKDNGRIIWRYRDEVIKAFNQNMPYDKFIINQMAGDLIPNATLQQKILTAFHRNTMTNTEGGTNDEEFRIAAVLDRVNTTWEAFMGTTYSCVQCHTHPYDPIKHDEYFKFMAFLNNTADNDRNNEHPVISTPTDEEKDRLEKMKAELKKLEAELKSAQLKPRTSSAKKGDNYPLAFSSLNSKNGNSLKHLGEGLVIAKPTKLAKDTYTLEAKTEAKAFGYLKLDAIPHESFANRSGVNGNFVISDLSARIVKSSPVKGRFVRVSLNKKEALNLAEVEVISNGKNIALKKKASQSSTYQKANASKAIDGNTEGKFTKKSVTHTNTENSPWWEVDLGKENSIDSVNVFNRLESQERLNGYTLTVLNAKRQIVWQETVSKAKMKNLHETSGEFKVQFVSSQANFEQKDYYIKDSINGKSKDLGWAIASKESQKNTAWISPEFPVALEENDKIKIIIACESKWKTHIIGHFKISIGENIPGFLQEPQEIKDLKAKKTKLATSIKNFKMTTTPIMQELTSNRRKTKVFIRGNWEDLAEEVSEGTPEVMNPFKKEWPKNRLGMAYWMTDPANPLVSRVAVNRFWEQIFGTGIVETLEDFGSQGSKPTHPKLLDTLAWKFINEYDWNIKALLKEMVMSATYRQTSNITKELQEKDPFNVYLARAPRFRMSAEQLRDQALQVSGLLSKKMYGPSVMPYQPEGVWMTVYNGRKWILSKGEDKHRRALYTYWKRTSPYPSMETFDTPSREVCKVRRIRTNTPLQALVTLNDPVYVECAKEFAGQILKNGGSSLDSRLNYAFEKALCRKVKPREQEILKSLLEDTMKVYKKNEQEAWAVLAGTIMNLDEFLTKK